MVPGFALIISLRSNTLFISSTKLVMKNTEPTAGYKFCAKHSTCYSSGTVSPVSAHTWGLFWLLSNQYKRHKDHSAQEMK